MKLSINKAIDLFEKFKPWDILRKHSFSVAKVSAVLSHKYFKKGLLSEQEVYQVIISAVLHDSLKCIELNIEETNNDSCSSLKEKYKGLSHEDAGALKFKEYPVVSKMIKNHAYYAIDKLSDLKEKILYYADKLDSFGVIDSSVVLRLLKAHLRYKDINKNNNDWLRVFETDIKILKLEQKLLKPVGLNNDFSYLNNFDLDKLLNDLDINKDLLVEC